MASTQLLLPLLGVLLLNVAADPAPGRIPKVYNALITSNQNLEPSKAYPVYQPVLHDAFSYSYQPTLFYGGDLVGNGLLPPPPLPPRQLQPSPSTPSSTSEPPSENSPSPTPESSPTTSEPPKDESESRNATPPPLAPPNTPPPIPLNEFGLPPQVIPLGPGDYNALPQFNPFAYRYPSLRFYDPYDPFSFSPYASFPSIYRPVPPISNVLGQSLPILAGKPAPQSPAPSSSAQTPPPEPSDLNVLNYSSKDPTIPNVPPPPLPQGGLKSDKSE